MKLLLAVTSAAFLALSAPAFAQGASSLTPGHELQKKGPVKGTHGASGYTPGHEMQRHEGLTEGRSSAIDRDDTMRKRSPGASRSGT